MFTDELFVIVSNAPLFGVWEKATALANTTSAIQQISFITMHLELFTFIFVSPSIFFLGCLLGGRPIFPCKNLIKFPRILCHEISANRWPMKHETTDRRSRMLAEERESTSRAPVLENGGTKSRTTQNGPKPNPED